jgi:hypothetical protein
VPSPLPPTLESPGKPGCLNHSRSFSARVRHPTENASQEVPPCQTPVGEEALAGVMTGPDKAWLWWSWEREGYWADAKSGQEIEG